MIGWFKDQMGKMLETIQVLKSSIHISEDSWSSGSELELTIQEEKLKDFNAKKTILLEDTTILHGGGDNKLVEEILQDNNLVGKTSKADGGKEATVLLNTTLYTSVDKEKTQEGLSRLSSGVIILKIGEASEAKIIFWSIVIKEQFRQEQLFATYLHLNWKEGGFYSNDFLISMEDEW